MMKSLPNQKDPVLVLGSKPDSILPDIRPVHIYAANAAALKSKTYRELNPDVQLTCIVDGRGILEESLQKVIYECAPNRIITKNPCLHSLNDLFPDFKNRGVRLEDRNKRDIYYFQHSIFGRRTYWAEWLKLTTRSRLKNPFKVPKILYNLVRDKYPRGTSSGLFSVIMAATEYPEHPIVTSGISLQGGGHFNQIGYFSSARGKIDKYLCRSLPADIKKNLYTVDPSMAANGGVQMAHLASLT